MSQLAMYKGHLAGDRILQPADNRLGIIVTIPAFNEVSLLPTLESLWKADRPACLTEVIVVINAAENASNEVLLQNEHVYQESMSWVDLHYDETLRFYIFLENQLPAVHAGVGLARKIAMDEAALRFLSISKPSGVISCFDADSTCSKNYLRALENHFNEHRKSPACSIYFEHPIQGEEFSREIYDAILLYELHLRYFKNALQYIGFPFAFHTVGSSMAVRCDAYVKQGGMNKRKAGEDFYFLQKIMTLGHFTELNNAAVYPSPRPSDRVPFGTGRAIQQRMNSLAKEGDSIGEYKTYHIQSFLDLKSLFKRPETLFSATDKESNGWLEQQPVAVKQFLEQSKFSMSLDEMKRNSSTTANFKKRFYTWFNGFRVLKYIHFARDFYHRDESVVAMSNQLLSLFVPDDTKETYDALELLKKYRTLDRGDVKVNNPEYD